MGKERDFPLSFKLTPLSYQNNQHQTHFYSKDKKSDQIHTSDYQWISGFHNSPLYLQCWMFLSFLPLSHCLAPPNSLPDCKILNLLQASFFFFYDRKCDPTYSVSTAFLVFLFSLSLILSYSFNLS